MVPFIQQFIEGFATHHSDVSLTIYSLYIPKGKPYNWKTINVIPLNGEKGSLFSKLYLIVKSTIIISNHIRKSHADGILSFWYNETALIAKIVSFINSKKHYTWLQGQDVKNANFYMKYLRPKPNSIIALSSHQNNILYNELGFKAKVVNPIAVNPSFFPSLNTKQREIDILGAGSFIPLKNYHLFLGAVLDIIQHQHSIKVVLIGNGPLHDQFKDFIKENNLENNIKLTGLLPHKDTLAYMNNAKIFLHTSNFEGGGMVLYEALYSGCQLISTIPIEDNTTPNFHHCSSKKEIVDTLKKLLLTPKSIERSSCTDIKDTTKTIYDLFFSE